MRQRSLSSQVAEKIAGYKKQAESLETRIKAKDKTIEVKIMEIVRLENKIKQLDKKLNSSLSSFVQGLEKGKYVVSVFSYERSSLAMAKKKVYDLKKQYPTIGAGKFLDSNNK